MNLIRFSWHKSNYELWYATSLSLWDYLFVICKDDLFAALCSMWMQVLGTFLTEWDEGRIISNKMLSSKEYSRMCAERLTELAIALGFDGWLVSFSLSLLQGTCVLFRLFQIYFLQPFSYMKIDLRQYTLLWLGHR